MKGKNRQKAIFSSLDNLEAESSSERNPPGQELHGAGADNENKPMVPDSSSEAISAASLFQFPKVNIPCNAYNFGSIQIGETQEWDLRVKNDGNADFHINSLAGLPANGFHLLNPPSVPFRVSPGSQVILTVRFAPESEGRKAATLFITSSEGSTQTMEVVFTGTSTAVATVHCEIGSYPMRNSLGMAFVHIPEGSFLMGSPESEPGRSKDETQHEVIITDFYLHVSPVTQRQWRELMGNNPSFFSNGSDDCPVENVTWHDCLNFINRLNGLGEGTYRLPTEAEWEYACRAGSVTGVSNGELTKLFCDHDPYLGQMGWYCGNSNRQTHPVMQKQPNPWGLYDMHGNVNEWCQDWYNEYPDSSQRDPLGQTQSSGRVARGGCWFSSAKNCRSASRLCWPPNARNQLQLFGFRLVGTFDNGA